MSRTYGPGDTFRRLISVQDATGAATNADSTPTAALWRNGASTGAVAMTVTNVQTGLYLAEGVIGAGWSYGDDVTCLGTVTVDGVPGPPTVLEVLRLDRTNAAIYTLLSTVDTALGSLATAAALATADGVIDDVLADLLVLKAALVGTAAKNATTGTVTATTDDARTVTVAQSETVRTLTVS